MVNQKLDPYLNVDPGTMNPLEHGEVFVTDDGGETDLDLGHYERFTGENLRRDSNVTTGSVYHSIIQRERRGEFLGATVQVIPHITNEIKARIRRLGDSPDVDVVITEVGGTVGDIEILAVPRSHPSDEQRRRRRKRCIHPCDARAIHRSFEELKTKPTQHSVAELRSRGIQPDAIVLRADREVEDSIKRKISLFCDVSARAVVTAQDAPSIYQVPLDLHEGGLDAVICESLGLETPDPDLSDWRAMVKRMFSPEDTITVALVGKYVDLPDAYLSVVEALGHAGTKHGVKVDIRWVSSDEMDGGLLVESHLQGADAIVVPGGFGHRGVEGKVQAIRYARERGIPFLGLCLGLQCAVIEFARSKAGLAEANSTEFAPTSPHPVIDLMESQRDVDDKGGTMRLGLYAARLAEGSTVRELYGEELVYERHRHRYEVNNRYRTDLEDAGMQLTGLSPDGKLVEFVEIADHPFFVATQAHPELRSRPDDPHPLFDGFVGAARERHMSLKADGVVEDSSIPSTQ